MVDKNKLLNLIGPEPSDEEITANQRDYMIADIEGKQIFLHEVMWVYYNRKPIPNGSLVCHKDGDFQNNTDENLGLVEENKSWGDLHQNENKIFHESNTEKNKEFIKKQFEDIYEILWP